ncbi:MAG: hypothetical protein AVO35_01135 [Candidatus Aegiribacteria sp. MLS_C]|nr:MAG: hypothetical protein AVO35_01135 [Candidatus Aegiribacteria sp. MLS_C]
MDRYDLVIIGGGPAGYVPAIRAAQMGRSVAVIEEWDIGGTCLNRGCIPTKTLVSSTELLRAAADARRFGLEGGLAFSWEALSRRRELVVNRLRKGVEAHLKELGVATFQEHGEILGSDRVRAGGKTLEASRVILSPGSVSIRPGPFASDGVDTSREVLEWSTLPKSLIVVGGGVIGCEFASIFSSLGVKVDILEMLPGILPGVDADVRQVVERSLKKSGVGITTGSAARDVSGSGGSLSVALENGSVFTAERILVSVGRRARTGDLGLDAAGIKYDGSGIYTDEFQMTSLPGVYAAGDVTGRWHLAHAGSAQALAAVDHMFGSGGRRVNPDAIPGCIFTSPEIAIVGPGQEEWERRGVQVDTGVSRYIANGKAVGMNETDGFVKIIARHSDGVVVGVQIVGAHASSLVGQAVMAVNLGVRAVDIGRMIHPHPTLCEMFMEAGEAFGAGSIHG